MSVERILVTGFEPFGGETINTSWDVAQALQGRLHGSAPATAVQPPCVFALSLSAGSFVCNQFFHGLLQALRRGPASSTCRRCPSRPLPAAAVGRTGAGYRAGGRRPGAVPGRAAGGGRADRLTVQTD